jgi:hypothetical protein
MRAVQAIVHSIDYVTHGSTQKLVHVTLVFEVCSTPIGVRDVLQRDAKWLPKMSQDIIRHNIARAVYIRLVTQAEHGSGRADEITDSEGVSNISV